MLKSSNSPQSIKAPVLPGFGVTGHPVTARMTGPTAVYCGDSVTAARV